MRMRWTVAGLLALLVSSASAVTLDELVAKNLEARGGAARLAAIKTLKTSGKLLVGDQFELGFAQYQKAPESTRVEASLQD